MTDKDLLITNAAVCDVASARTEADQCILVKEGRIAHIARHIGADGVRVIDAGGRVVTPGLIDAHVHVTAATADLSAQAEWSPSYVAAHTFRIMEGMLGRGFTTVRDVGGADYGIAAAVQEGLVAGPRVLFGGKALSQTGGHADMRNRGRTLLDQHRCCPFIGMVCDGADAVRHGAREQLRTGGHHLKIMLSGGVASPTDRVDSTQFSDDEIRAAVQEAAAVNRYVTGHAYTARAVNRGLELGVRCIEHGNLIDDRSVELFNRHDAFLVPTLVTYEYLAKEGKAAGLPPESQDKVALVLDAGLDALELAWRGGVSIAFGTDLLGDMHVHQSDEFRIRAQVQPPSEILKSATTTAARLVGMEDEIGVIAPGARADLLIVDGDPLTDHTVFSEPDMHLQTIIQDGRLVANKLG